MFPELIKIGNFTIYTYGFMLAIGIVSALVMALYRGKRRGFNNEEIIDIAFYGVIGGIIGAKLLYLITQAGEIIRDPSSIKGMITGGFVIYGAIIGGVLSSYIYCRVKGLTFIKYFDLLVPSVAFAQGFGRIGCLMAGCCYGRETTSSIGIVFKRSLYAPSGISLYPTQIISSVGDFSIAAILLIFAARNKKEGHVAGLYLILYSIGRFLVEFLRGDPRGTVGVLSTSQFICIFIFAGGLILMGRREK